MEWLNIESESEDELVEIMHVNGCYSGGVAVPSDFWAFLARSALANLRSRAAFRGLLPSVEGFVDRDKCVSSNLLCPSQTQGDVNLTARVLVFFEKTCATTTRRPPQPAAGR
jgi:hypothetical protein